MSVLPIQKYVLIIEYRHAAIYENSKSLWLWLMVDRQATSAIA